MHTVPSCWLLGNNSVKWPTSGSATSLIIKCIDIVNDEWEARNIKIYSMASTYESAERKLERHLDTSNVSDSSSSDEENQKKVPQKRACDSNNAVDVSQRKYPKTLPKSSFEPAREQRFRVKKTSGPKTSQHKLQSQSSSTNSCETVDVDNLDEHQTVQNDSSDAFAKKVFRLLMDVQSRLKQLKTEVRENMKKIDKIEEKIDGLQGVSPSPNPIVFQHEAADFNFPVTSSDHLMELEQQLLDDKNANKLCLHLSARPSSSMKQMVLSIMKYVLTRTIALEYNLNGLKEKKKFVGLHICNIIIAAVQVVYKEETTADIMKRIRKGMAKEKKDYLIM